MYLPVLPNNLALIHSNMLIMTEKNRLGKCQVFNYESEYIEYFL